MYPIPFGKPIIGEEERNAVLQVLDGPILVHGPVAKQFEADFASFTQAPGPSAFPLAQVNHLIYHTLGYGPGDEVIVPAQTHIATAHAVELTGAKAVFVDAETKQATSTLVLSKQQSHQGLCDCSRSLSGSTSGYAQGSRAARLYNYLFWKTVRWHSSSIGRSYGASWRCRSVFLLSVKHFTTAEGETTCPIQNWRTARTIESLWVDRTHGERKIPGVYDTTDLGFNYRMVRFTLRLEWNS